jgi:predicted transcriptional regulator
MSSKLSVMQVRKVAAELGVDPRTVETYLSGERRTNAVVARAIDDALVRLGIAVKVRRAG